MKTLIHEMTYKLGNNNTDIRNQINVFCKYIEQGIKEGKNVDKEELLKVFFVLASLNEGLSNKESFVLTCHDLVFNKDDAYRECPLNN
jgi:hypothetical protein